MLRNDTPSWNKFSYSGRHINPEPYLAYECKFKAGSNNICPRLNIFLSYNAVF